MTLGIHVFVNSGDGGAETLGSTNSADYAYFEGGKGVSHY